MLLQHSIIQEHIQIFVEGFPSVRNYRNILELALISCWQYKINITGPAICRGWRGYIAIMLMCIDRWYLAMYLDIYALQTGVWSILSMQSMFNLRGLGEHPSEKFWKNSKTNHLDIAKWPQLRLLCALYSNLAIATIIWLISPLGGVDNEVVCSKTLISTHNHGHYRLTHGWQMNLIT